MNMIRNHSTSMFPKKDKIIYKENDPMQNTASLFPFAKKRNDSNTHNAPFSHKAMFLLFKTV